MEEVSGDAVTREAFLAAYAGDEFDVIWVISHAGDHPTATMRARCSCALGTR
ncbi:hypothetical protein BN2537_101 [Streptomyces venezuelae]|nr:hypothetical protein BN2537_101 [Streptomyces venezuelae]